jgi:hypothetical protein
MHAGIAPFSGQSAAETVYIQILLSAGILSQVTKATPTPESVFRKRGGVLRMSEALAAGINRRSLYALRDAGTITQLSRGVYRLASLPDLEAPDLVTVSARVPSGVV